MTEDKALVANFVAFNGDAVVIATPQSQDRTPRPTPIC
jgi:hypothetical protein